MPTPVGPAPADPDDPDLWDWGGEDNRPRSSRHPAQAVVSALIIVILVMLIAASQL